MEQQQWQYCSVTSSLFGQGRPSVTFYLLSGKNEVFLQDDEHSSSGEDAVYRLVAMLGRDGWEMVGTSAGNYYFKRPTTMQPGTAPVEEWLSS